MRPAEAAIRSQLERNGQTHVLRFWDRLDDAERTYLLDQIDSIDFALMSRLIDRWIRTTPPPETFSSIAPISVVPKASLDRPDAREAREAGENALRQGRVGLFLVAGGQGTRLGFAGPKGAYPIGPVSGRSLFAFHAEKIRNLQERYACVLPWYIMVSDANAEATEVFFAEHGHFGLDARDIRFFRQRMVPCVDGEGRFLLDAPGSLAMNPNGHGGCIPAMVENGVIEDAKSRGVDTLSYFQVDNWAIKVADPFFIGYHVLRGSEMSSKIHRKHEPREAVGVHCLCDGEYRVIEYTELDIYPQLLDTDAQGNVLHYAGNPAIHILATDFVTRIYNRFDSFPWHCSHKKIPYVNDDGVSISPERPNGYKFETFVFDALRFVERPPVALEIDRAGEYTPIKSFEDANGVKSAWTAMNAYWATWFEAAGCPVPRDAAGRPAVRIEVSPRFASSRDEFIEKTSTWRWPSQGDLAIDPDGKWIGDLDVAAGAS